MRIQLCQTLLPQCAIGLHGPQRPYRTSSLQDWLTDADVQKWLNKYDWDSSGDICFLEFEALVRTTRSRFTALHSFGARFPHEWAVMLRGAQARGGALLDGKLEEYERAWKAAGGEDISSDGLEDLFVKLGQPLDAERLAQVRRLPQAHRLPRTSAGTADAS